MSPRVYERRFDWDEARRLHAEGTPIAEIARAMGVTDAAIRRVVVEGYAERDYERRSEWLRSGVCPNCGGPSTRRSKNESLFCRACNAKRMATTVREDELWCASCKQWKPDRAFPRSRSESHRRGRHGQCTPCQTRAKRDYRRRHPEYKG